MTLTSLFMFCFIERKASYVDGKRDNEVKRTRRETSSSVRGVESGPRTEKEGKTRVESVLLFLISCGNNLENKTNFNTSSSKVITED